MEKRTVGMHTSGAVAEVAHIEWYCTNFERTERFCVEVFAWQLSEGDQVRYCRNHLQHVGAFRLRARVVVSDGPVVYVATPDIRIAVARAARSGGVVLSMPTPVDDVGLEALVADPDGNRFGLLEYTDDSA